MQSNSGLCGSLSRDNIWKWHISSLLICLMSVISLTPTSSWILPYYSSLKPFHVLVQTDLPTATFFLGLFLLKIKLVFLCLKDPNINVKSPNLKGARIIQNSSFIELEANGGWLHLWICMLIYVSSQHDQRKAWKKHRQEVILEGDKELIDGFRRSMAPNKLQFTKK